MVLVCPSVSLSESHAQDVGQFHPEIDWEGGFYPGGTIIIKCNYTNTGTLSLRILSATLATDFGSFTSTPGQPFIVPVGNSKVLDLTVRVPSKTAEGKHYSSFSTSFQYLHPSSQQWFTPAESPYAFHFNIPLGPNPSPSYLLYLVGALVSLIFVAVVLFRRRWVGGVIVPGSGLGRSTKPNALARRGGRRL